MNKYATLTAAVLLSLSLQACGGGNNSVLNNTPISEPKTCHAFVGTASQHVAQGTARNLSGSAFAHGSDYNVGLVSNVKDNVLLHSYTANEWLFGECADNDNVINDVAVMPAPIITYNVCYRWYGSNQRIVLTGKGYFFQTWAVLMYNNVQLGDVQDFTERPYHSYNGTDWMQGECASNDIIQYT